MFDVSVVITCYNLEKYVGLAIQSVLNQKFPGNAQVIVVDDCSSDDSAKVIQKYPVQYIRTPVNSGVLNATVVGLNHCEADVVAFLDGDDIWHPNKLGLVLETFLDRPGIGFLTHDLIYIDANGGECDRRSKPERILSRKKGTSTPGDLVREGILRQKDYVWLGSAVVIKKSIIDLTGFLDFVRRLDDSRNVYQDWPIAVWCAAQPHVGIAYIPEKLFSYRLHGLNHSGDAGSVEKALRNLRRTYNTLVFCKRIMQHCHLDKDFFREIDEKCQYYKGLIFLYEGQRLKALREIALSIKYIAFGDVVLVKELMRIFGLFFLGYDRVLRIKSLFRGCVFRFNA